MIMALAEFLLCALNIHVHRRSQGGDRGPCPPQIFSISSHFALWEAECQTNYCCSP